MLKTDKCSSWAAVAESLCRSDDEDCLAERLLPHRRILLWGETGIGKSNLALRLLPKLNMLAGGCQLLHLDPASAPFGIPGTVGRGWWTAEGFTWGDCQALCTLNSGRFRLPLVLATRRLLGGAVEKSRGTLVIDPPGVVRGVGGAELLTALAECCGVDAVVAIRREGGGLAPIAELVHLAAELVLVTASPAARVPARLERLKNRTRLWDQWLQGGEEQLIDLEDLLVLGTPPPFDVPDAWTGRQAALLSEIGETVAIGEILRLENNRITARLRHCRSGRATVLLVRDCGRDGSGRLATITPVKKAQTSPQVPVEMGSPNILTTFGKGPVSSHLGTAWATLVGGVFGDPLLHVRLCQRKKSFLFDLGDPSRLLGKMVHQVHCVFLSHAHLDHIGGFLWFLRSRIGDFPACKIFGPVEIINRLQNFIDAVTWDRIEERGPVFDIGEFDGKSLRRARLQPGKNRKDLAGQPVSNGVIMAEEDYLVRCVICDHHIPSLAYSFEFRQDIRIRKDRILAAGLATGPWLGRLKKCAAAARLDKEIDLPDGNRIRAGELVRDLLVIRPGKKLVYVTDLADTKENRRKVTELAESAHTLFCETAFTESDRDKATASQHLTTSAAISIAREAGVKRLVPFHFSKRYEHNPGVIYDELLAAAGPLQILGPDS